MSASTEDTNKEEGENKDFIDKDTLLYIAVGAGVLGLLGVGGIVATGWLKEQDQQKKKLAAQQQMLERQKLREQEMMRMRQLQQERDEGWPDTIPRNTVPQSSAPPIMTLPSERDYQQEEEDQFIGGGYRIPSPVAYNTDQQQQKFVVSDDPMRNGNYPVINPNAQPQQIGQKISRVMNLDGAGNPSPQYQQQGQLQQSYPQQIKSSSSSDDEDFSDLF